MKRQAAACGRPFDDSELHATVTPPLAGVFVWDCFWSLNRGRGGTGYGPAPIPYSEILAWVQLYQQPLEIWEVNAIRSMDGVFLEEVSKLQNDEG